MYIRLCFYAVGCHYNMVQYNTLWNTMMHDESTIQIRLGSHNRTPIARSVSVAGTFEKIVYYSSTALYHVVLMCSR